MLPKDFPSLSDPFNNMIPADLPHTELAVIYKYAEKGPLTVEQLLAAHKIQTESGVLKSM